MSTPVPFTSSIGLEIDQFVEHKQDLGRCYESQRHRLLQLDRFLAASDDSDLTAASFAAWCSFEQVLRVRESKFHKSRLIPLSKDAAAELERYDEDRRQPGFPTGAEAPLLIHRRGSLLTAYSGNGLRVLLRKLFRIADVRTAAAACRGSTTFGSRSPSTH